MNGQIDGDTLLAVDGNCLLARAAFAVPEAVRSPNGDPVNAVFGFLSMVTSAIRAYNGKYVVVAFDPEGTSFRKSMMPTYKAGRVALPGSFAAQLRLAKHLLATLGIPVRQLDTYEADDILASIAARGRDAGLRVLVVTTDRDTLQLIEDPRIAVLLLRRGLTDAVLYDEPQLIKRWGIGAKDYVLFAALRGDPSDNLTGVSGVGEKTAAQLTHQFRSAESLFAHASQLPARIGEALISAKADVFRNIKMTELVRDLNLQLPEALDHSAWRGIAVRSELAEHGLAGLYPKLVAANAYLSSHSSTRGLLGSLSGLRRDHALGRPAALALVACGASKRSELSRAADLYTSALFRESRKYAESHAARWFILSAKHGLLHPDRRVEPYDVALGEFSPQQRVSWAKKVVNQVNRELTIGDGVVTILGGSDYTRDLRGLLASRGIDVDLPLDGLALPVRIRWLESANSRRGAGSQLDVLYKLLNVLANATSGPFRLSDCSSEMPWPERGVYVFFEHGEYRSDSRTPRVVRVGTHAVSRGSRSTLWSRLRAHRGLVTGGGLHRSSIFRLHVGAALLAKSGRTKTLPQWGEARVDDELALDQERALENEVSKYIGAMDVLYLSVLDEPSPTSDRAYLERNLIALLGGSGASIDPPSTDWLGRASPHSRIQHSGLWNLNYVEDGVDERFLDVLAEYVDRTMRRTSAKGSIAPRSWWVNGPGRPRQGVLFSGRESSVG